MKKYTAHYVIAITLFFASIASGMDLPSTRNPALRAAAQKYNKNHPLIAISNDQLNDIIVNPKKSLEENIKMLLAWSITCTDFNNRLADFGKMLKPYDTNAKNALLPKLLPYYRSGNNCTKRALLLLVYGGVEHNTRYPGIGFLEIAVGRDDIDMVNTLFENGANPSLRKFLIGDPIFFGSTNTKMIQLFLDNGADINEAGRTWPNVLWNCIFNPELIEFYIGKGADPRTLYKKKKSILYTAYYYHHCTPRILKVIELLLNHIGDMINMTDNKGKTALDYLITKKRYRQQEIIHLFKQHGAKTSQELKQVKKPFK